ncbi:MAG: YdcF family protein [Actinobacteria bacterium]|nr:YdcF family protein [Actinomycetota bacterium]
MWRLLRILMSVVVLWAAAAAVIFAADHGGKPVHADAIVVLSGSQTRLPVGVRLLRQGYAPLLVVSQGGHESQLERHECAGGVPHVRCFRASPYSTHGEAEAIGRLARELHLRRLDVVTSQFHVFRAGILIRRCFHGTLRMVGAPQDWWRLPWFAATETAKLVYQETVQREC